MIEDPAGTVELSSFRINTNADESKFIAVCRCRGLFDPDKFATGPEGHPTMEEATRALAQHIVERHRADVGEDTEDDVYAYLMANWKRGSGREPNRHRPRRPVLRGSVPYTADDLATRHMMSALFSRALRKLSREERRIGSYAELRAPDAVLEAWGRDIYGGFHVVRTDADQVEVYGEA